MIIQCDYVCLVLGNCTEVFRDKKALRLQFSFRYFQEKACVGICMNTCGRSEDE